LEVKAGYARNYLIPQKFALYATRQNFKRLDMKDPDLETPEEKRERLRKEASDESDQELRAADLLRKYFSNKTLFIYRDTEDDSDLVPLNRKPVNHKVIRKKLSKQLRIDLDDHEMVHITPDTIMFDEVKEDEIEAMMKNNLTQNKEEVCSTEIRKLGDYLARIWLAGDHYIPLRVSVVRRP